MRTFVLVGIALLSVSPGAYALPSFRTVLEKHAGYKTSCRACHQPRDNRLTTYGREYGRLGRGLSALEALDYMDPDQDGLSSRNELARRANPGDPRSTPDYVGNWLADLEPTVPPEAPLRAVFGDTVDFAVLEKPLPSDRVERAETFLGERLQPEEAVPTVFVVRQTKQGREVVGYATYAFFGKSRISSLLVIMLPGAVRQAGTTPSGDGPIIRDVRPLRVHGDQRLAKEDYVKQFEGRTYDTLLGVAAPRGAEAQNAELLHAVKRAMKIAELAVEK